MFPEWGDKCASLGALSSRFRAGFDVQDIHRVKELWGKWGKEKRWRKHRDVNHDGDREGGSKKVSVRMMGNRRAKVTSHRSPTSHGDRPASVSLCCLVTGWEQSGEAGQISILVIRKQLLLHIKTNLKITYVAIPTLCKDFQNRIWIDFQKSFKCDWEEHL